MTEEVLDGEVVAEAESISTVPFGWCLSGHHVNCPGIIGEHTWPDPARRNAVYTVSARACSCPCHTRHTL